MRSKDFLLAGRLISCFGDSLYSVAIMWYVFEVTRDSLITGLASSILMLPMVLSVFAGPIIDHFNRKHLMLLAQFIQMILMATITILFYFELMPLPLLIFSFFIIGMLEIFEGNAEHALSPTIMNEEELVRFNSIVVTGNLLISSIAKAFCIFIILSTSIESIYIINFFTFLFAVLLFSKVKYKHREQGALNLKMYHQSIVEGISYFKRFGLIWLAFPAMIANFTSAMSQAVLPAFTYEKGGDSAYGYFLTSLVIFGAIGSLLTPKLKNIDINLKIIIAPLLSGLFIFLSANFNHYFLSMLMYGLSALPLVIMNITTSTYIQTHVDNHILSRVGTILSAICTIVMPFGALFGGWLGKTTRPEFPLYMTALGFFVLALIFLSRKLMGKNVIAISKEPLA
ncbi:MFS transporter [Macrococcus bovicus]|uniref:MFS transporter n=1 Tax=Macrococcus bovicus TaxID=69968 RepID=UPI0025A5B042|nr:MFS transporter [Macrococcus bovicus]WJP97878.1 MFS transporter [Macrococcus bovicus]